jgi:hypothetical protein
VKKLKLVTDDGPTMELDLTGDLSNLKSKVCCCFSQIEICSSHLIKSRFNTASKNYY